MNYRMSFLNRCLNEYIKHSDDLDIQKLYPISHETLSKDRDICNTLIDYLGDIYVSVGFDKKYAENDTGRKISELIDYISKCSNLDQNNDSGHSANANDEDNSSSKHRRI